MPPAAENEVLMHFRGLRKAAGDVSLSESIDTDGDGNSLSLMDILADEEDMADRVSTQEMCLCLRRYVNDCLDQRRRKSSGCAMAWTAGRP